NVLNSVNVSAAVIQRVLSQSASRQLERLAELIEEHLNDFPTFVSEDSKGKKTPAFIVKISDAIKGERSQMDSEFGDLVSNIEHIKEIVAVQQEAANSAGLLQSVSPQEVVEDAIVANKGTLTNHAVAVQRDFESDLPEFTSDKRKILQILINLIKNAKDAVVEAGASEPNIQVRISRNESEIAFAVQDNGIGISAAKLQKIFQHGFTTKKHGHGFGLHSSANAATELGGRLDVQSEGLGAGSTFVLTLPLEALQPEDRESSNYANEAVPA
ncbi:MAG: ATP-binding protein, partial [Planctomycetota bacterium]